jgi:hypothetical protein
VNTIAAQTSRIPRVVLIVLVALVAAFALLMVVRSGVLGGSDSGATSVTKPLPATSAAAVAATPSGATTPAVPAKARIVLLPGLPSTVAHALRYSKVTVVSVYVGQAAGDHASVAEAHRGARAAGAGFVAVNVGSDKQAATVAKFAGEVSSPSTLIVRRPGRIVMQFSGPVESAIVRQAAHNAGARR